MHYRIPRKTLLIAFLSSLIFPLLIFLVLSPLIDRAVEAESTERAFRVAEHLKNHLDLHTADLAAGRWSQEIDQEVRDITESFGLYETCIIATDGNIAYSSRKGLRGERVTGELFDNLLAKGRRYFAVKHRGEVSLEGFVVTNAVIEAYVPLHDQGRLIGGVATFYDFSELHDKFARLKVYFAVLLFVISFGAMMLVYIYHVKAERGRQLRAEAEEALEQEQIKAETVFSSLGDHVIIQDRDYRIIYQNSINRDVWGDRRGEYCYTVFEGLDHVCTGCPVELTYRDGGIHKHEKEVVTPDGVRNFELTASTLRNPDGEIVAGIELVRDISEKRNIEEQLRHAQKMQAIGTLASGISHEFNNLLTSINGFSEMLLEMVPQHTDQHRYLDAIHHSGKRAEALTKGLLAYSRKQISNKTLVSLNDIFQGMEQVLLKVIGSNIMVGLDLARESLSVMADRHQLEQVLLNMITNARDAMPDGGQLSIRTSCVTADETFVGQHGVGTPDVQYALISVRDTGHGMNQQVLEQIFEPFFTTKDVGRGTGLGLSIACGIVEQHGGFMDVTSAPGTGTEFCIYLPVPPTGGASASGQFTEQSFW